jgi:hypothetical protein
MHDCRSCRAQRRAHVAARLQGHEQAYALVALDVCLSYDAGCHRLGDAGERLVELLYELTERRRAPRCVLHAAFRMRHGAPNAERTRAKLRSEAVPGFHRNDGRCMVAGRGRPGVDAAEAPLRTEDRPGCAMGNSPPVWAAAPCRSLWRPRPLSCGTVCVAPLTALG